MPYAWLNGAFISRANLHFDSDLHTLHYAGGVIEGECAYPELDADGQPTGHWHIVLAERHAERMIQGAHTFGHRIDPSPEVLIRQATTAAAALVALNLEPDDSRLYVRRLITRDTGLGVSPVGRSSSVSVVTKKWGGYLSRGIVNGGASALVTKWQRPTIHEVPGHVKSTGKYEAAQLVELETEAAGASIGIFVNGNGDLLDTSGANFLALREDGVVVYPDNAQENILGGLTQRLLRERIFGMIGIECTTGHIQLADFMPRRRENGRQRSPMYVGAFLAGTTVEVFPVTMLMYRDRDDKVRLVPVGSGHPHRQILAIQDMYRRFMHGQIPGLNGPDHLLRVPGRAEAQSLIEVSAVA